MPIDIEKEKEEKITTAEKVTQEDEPSQATDEPTEDEESIKNPLEERRKAAGRKCLQTLKGSCSLIALGDACLWTARFACEQTLEDAIPSAENEEIKNYILKEDHLWQDETTKEEEKQEDGFFSFF